MKIYKISPDSLDKIAKNELKNQLFYYSLFFMFIYINIFISNLKPYSVIFAFIMVFYMLYIFLKIILNFNSKKTMLASYELCIDENNCKMSAEKIGEVSLPFGEISKVFELKDKSLMVLSNSKKRIVIPKDLENFSEVKENLKSKFEITASNPINNVLIGTFIALMAYLIFITSKIKFNPITLIFGLLIFTLPWIGQTINKLAVKNKGNS